MKPEALAAFISSGTEKIIIKNLYIASNLKLIMSFCSLSQILKHNYM